MSARDGAFYRTAGWAAIRKRQLARAPFCYCGAPATEVDHIKRIKEGGAKRDADNLQSLCHRHHSEKTNAEKAGRAWIKRGCDADGMPLDPAHPWHPGGVQSRETMPANRRPTSKMN